MDIVNINYINKKDLEITKNFIEGKFKRFLLGRNKWTDSILEYFEVNGIIDDFTDEKFYKEYEIYKTEEIPTNSIVLSCSMGSPQTAKRKLNSFNIKNIDYFAFYKYSNLDIKPPPFITDFKKNFQENKKQYYWVYNKLADKESKKVFEKIVNFKLSYDLGFMNGFKNNVSLQYFEFRDYFKNSKITFIDGGGYIGDTTIEFIKYFSNYKKIYFFEPDKENFKTAISNLNIYPNIVYFPLGIYKSKTTLNFESDNASSCINKTGKEEIKVTSLDNTIKEPVDFIKLDIEGAEQEAIEGAKNIIKSFSPFMAICVYHKPDDLYKIPQKVLKINKNYKIYLRHYMEGSSESVMYFIPDY